MSEDWKSRRESWERLAWARERKFDKPTDAARALGMNPHTYAAYERPPGSPKHTPLKDERAKQFASKFGVDWVWLLDGVGSPYTVRYTAAQERVINAMVGRPDDEQERIASAVELLLKAIGG